MGSIGCKIASILRGDSDIYLFLSLPGKSSPKDWDFAAPEAILKAAGGSITKINNQELFYGKPDYEQRGIIIASNNKKTHIFQHNCFLIFHYLGFRKRRSLNVIWDTSKAIMGLWEAVRVPTCDVYRPY